MPRAKKHPRICKHMVVKAGSSRRCKLPADDEGFCHRHRERHLSTGPKTEEGKAAVEKRLLCAGATNSAVTARRPLGRKVLSRAVTSGVRKSVVRLIYSLY